MSKFLLHSVLCPCPHCKLQPVVLSTQFEEVPRCRHVLCVFVATFVCARACTSVWTMCVNLAQSRVGQTLLDWSLVWLSKLKICQFQSWADRSVNLCHFLLTPFISCSKFLLFDIAIWWILNSSNHKVHLIPLPRPHYAWQEKGKQ